MRTAKTADSLRWQVRALPVTKPHIKLHVMSGYNTKSNSTTVSRRLGVAAVEKIVIATLIVGVVGPIALVVGSNEMEILSQFSSTLEHSLAPENHSTGQRLASRSMASESSSLTAEAKLIAEPVSGSSASGRILWISLLSASIVTIGLLWAGFSGQRKDKKLSVQSASDLGQSLQSMKERLEKELRPGCVFTKRQQTMKTLLHQFDKLNCQGLQIHHLLTRKVKTIEPNATVEELRSLFTKKHYRHVLVCDSKKHLLGIITARDLQRKSGKTAADFMTTDLVSVSPDHSVCPVITMMMDKRVNCLPVIEDSRLIGIVTTTDLMIALQCTLQILSALGETSGQATSVDQSCSIV